MRRVLVSLLMSIVVVTLGLFVARCSKKGEEKVSHTSPEEGAERIYNIVDQMPRQINNVTVQYPKDALDAGIEGIVHIEMILDKNGNVENAQVSVSSGTLSLDRAALEAAKRCKFTPGMVEGRPVRMRLYKPFTFKLDRVNR